MINQGFIMTSKVVFFSFFLVILPSLIVSNSTGSCLLHPVTEALPVRKLDL